MSSKRDPALEFAVLLEEEASGSADLALVALLRSAGEALAPATTMADTTRAAQRQRLMAVAHVQAVQAASAPVAVAAPATGVLAGLRRFSAGLQATRRTAVVAGGMASVIAVAGVAVASSRSLPGDPFYSVKRTTEDAQLALARSDESRGELHLAIARTRLREVEGLANGRDAFALGPVATGPSGIGALGGSKAERILSTLDAMDDETQDGVETLLAVANEKKDPEPLRTISAFAATQGVKLGALLPTLPAAARQQASASLALVNEVQADSEQLLASSFCTASCDPAQALPTTPPAAVPGAPAPRTPSSPTTSAPCACAPTPSTPQRTPQPAVSPTASPTPSPLPTTPLAPVVPTTPPATPTTPPVTVPPVTVPPLIPLPLPTEIILPTIPGVPLPLPTSVPLPDLELPTLPGLPPLLGD